MSNSSLISRSSILILSNISPILIAYCHIYEVAVYLICQSILTSELHLHISLMSHRHVQLICITSITSTQILSSETHRFQLSHSVLSDSL